MPPKRKAAEGGHAGRYKVTDTVWAMFGPRWHQATVLECKQEAGKNYIYVHYPGWHVRHDDWLTEEEVEPDSPELREKAEKAEKDFDATKKKKKKKGGFFRVPQKVELLKKAPRGRKKKKKEEDEQADEAGEEEGETEEQKGEGKDGQAQGALSVEFPTVLRKWLVKDWDAIIRNRQLVQLPPKKKEATVADILAEFVESRSQRAGGGDDEEALDKVVQGLKALFDRALTSALLYPFEVPQFRELAANNSKRKGGFSPSEVYGVEHLARFLVQLPQLLAQTSMTRREFEFFQSQVRELVRWLSRNAPSYFGKPYKDTDRSYHDKIHA